MFKRFIISCDEATTICDKNQYGEATIFEKIKLSLHIFVCGFCKKYTEQNSLMTRFFDSYLERTTVSSEWNSCRNYTSFVQIDWFE